MTHGSIWLPFQPSDPRSAMFFLDTSSDGYLSGVGLGLWSSSQRIEPVCAFSSMFCEAFFADPVSGVIAPQQEDYVRIFIEDAKYEIMGGADEQALENAPELDIDPARAENQRLLLSAESALDLLLVGDEESALATDFARLPVDQRVAFFSFSDYSAIERGQAWSDFAGGAQENSKEQAAALCADHLLKAPGANLTSSTSYYWLDGQFLTLVYLNDDYDSPIIMPLGMAHGALASPNFGGPFGDGPAYLSRLTDIDRADVALLMREMDRRGASSELLFAGAAGPLLNAMREKQTLDALLNSTSKASQPGSRRLI